MFLLGMLAGVILIGVINIWPSKKKKDSEKSPYNVYGDGDYDFDLDEDDD